MVFETDVQHIEVGSTFPTLPIRKDCEGGLLVSEGCTCRECVGNMKQDECVIKAVHGYVVLYDTDIMNPDVIKMPLQ